MNSYQLLPQVPAVLPEIDPAQASLFRVKSIHEGHYVLHGIGAHYDALAMLWGHRAKLTALDILALPIPTQNVRMLALRPEVIPARHLVDFAFLTMERHAHGFPEHVQQHYLSPLMREYDAWRCGEICDARLRISIEDVRDLWLRGPERVTGVGLYTGVYTYTYTDNFGVPWTPWLDPAVIAQEAASAAIGLAYSRGSTPKARAEMAAREACMQFNELRRLLGGEPVEELMDLFAGVL